MMPFLVNSLIVVLTVIGMEIVAVLVHRYIMHGWGWGWHRSHHEPHDDVFERNDLYAVVFAAISIALIYFGTRGVWPLTWIGVGMAVYGLLYFIVHDGLVHQRWPFRYLPRRGYAKRLYQAHMLHHAVEGREGCVSFGFLYAPPVPRLKAELGRKQTLSKRGASESGSSPR
ncbi:sterol desaturase family protein [Consotaella salsifontis]|uniref:Beta-carotene 3-hydroxylase n=1 Tax=Consotaella salsifontis TaxID=1365950 RepID=A0A1T4L9E3_9HYPH|nr:sterol desaturase family protein [Consotaella salsifontis]SJZ51127.1 beta-carotene 3-hydroxylase [Consotaella salsifontis]